MIACLLFQFSTYRLLWWCFNFQLRLSSSSQHGTGIRFDEVDIRSNHWVERPLLPLEEGNDCDAAVVVDSVDK